MNGLSVGGVVNRGKAPTSASPGVYIVSLRDPINVARLDDSAIQKWIDRVPGMRLDGARPTVATLRERLEQFWIPTERILYIGVAGTSLATRLGVSFAEASTVADGPLATWTEDADHSNKEIRVRIVGWSAEGRLLVVIVSALGTRPRIISARRAMKRERRAYEARP